MKDTALIVVDVQNDLADENGNFCKEGNDVSYIQKMVSNLQNVVEKAREKGFHIIFIKSHYPRRYWISETPLCQEGTWGAEFYKLTPKESDIILIKHTNDGFFDTKLDSILKEKGIKNLLFAGITTNVCVDTTARGGVARGYKVTILEDCVASEDQELHRTCLKNFKTNFGDVKRSNEVIR